MHNAPLSLLIYLLYFKNSQILNRCELDPYVYGVFYSESALELNPEVVTLTPVTSCIQIHEDRWTDQQAVYKNKKLTVI
jgi:hypothetical protein